MCIMVATTALVGRTGKKPDWFRGNDGKYIDRAHEVFLDLVLDRARLVQCRDKKVELPVEPEQHAVPFRYAV